MKAVTLSHGWERIRRSSKAVKAVKPAAVIVLAMHLAAVACSHIMQYRSFQYKETEILLSLLRSSLYIALFTAWGFSVRYRIMAVHTRKYLTAEAALMVLWMFTRGVRYAFTAGSDLGRMLWYLYYIPMLLIPFAAILTSLSLGKYGEYRPPRWTKAYGAVSILLILPVLTNDLHQRIFVFPEDAVVFSDSRYTYAPLYYVVLGWELISYLLAFGIMLYRCRLPKKWTVMWLPAVPIAAAVLYTVLYTTKNPFISSVAPDLAAAICCLLIAAYECCIGTGMIPVNVFYRELVVHAGFPICIVNGQYETYLHSSSGKQLSEAVERSRGELPAMPDRQTRISSSAITGGNVFWAEDIGTLQKEIDALQDMQETLKESHMISMEEYRTNKEKVRLEESNRLYEKMQLETADCLGKLQELLRALKEENGETEQKRLLGNMAVYGAYYKRRNHLFFASESQQVLSGEELGYCLRETVEALAYLGIRAGYDVDVQSEYRLADMIHLYDLVQRIIEENLDILKALTVSVQKTEDEYTVIMTVSVEGETLSGAECFGMEKEAEGEYLLTYRYGLTPAPAAGEAE